MTETTYDFKLLQYFLVLMDERNVSHAAARLNLTQSAVSHALSRLRTLFGDKLLVKGRDRMTPTSRALEVEEQIRRLMNDADAIFHARSSFDPSTSAIKFTVMAAEYIEFLLAPKLSQLLDVEAPNVRIEFHPSDREHAHNWFEEGKIDYRIGWWPSPPQTLRVKLLFKERFACIARSGHPCGPGIALDDYLGATHVRTLSERTGTSERAIDRATSSIHRRLNIGMRVQGLMPLINAVAHSDMIATVPGRIAESVAEKFQLTVAPLPIANAPTAQVALYWHERTHNDAAHLWFRQKLVEVAKSL